MDGLTSETSIPQSDVFDLIRAERAYQAAKWTEAHDKQHPLGEWLLVCEGKLREAITMWQKNGSDSDTLSKLTYLAAVCVACLERLGGPMVAEWTRSMEFTRTNCGYMSPSERAKCWYPVLEAIQARQVAETLAEVSKSIQEM